MDIRPIILLVAFAIMLAFLIQGIFNDKEIERNIQRSYDEMSGLEDEDEQ